MDNEMLDGVIYKIEICNEFYIGSTTETLIERQRKHNVDLKRHNYKLYETCRANDINKITLIEIEQVKVNNKLELRILEQDYINKLEPTLNMLKAYMTEEEKKQYYKEYEKNRYLNNKEREKIKNKKYYENNKLQYKKNYENNKEKLKEKVKCEFCELEITKGSLTRHKKKYCKKVIN